jgi:hypothetical protein
MIFLRLSGGLGNQIFQLGASMLLADYSGASHLVIDDSFLNDYEAKRSNELGKFFDLREARIKIEFSKIPLAKYRLPKVLPLRFSFWPFVSDRNFKSVLQSTTNQTRYLDGYFQTCLSQKNFDDIRSLLIDISTLSENSFDSSVCVIHIRGGDFLKLGWNIIAPPSYYHSAMQLMTTYYNVRYFKVITDDVNYAEKIMSCQNVSYEISSNDMVSDFKTIAFSQRKILSSSTFALWASALGELKDPVVVCPRYFMPGLVRSFDLPGEYLYSKTQS